MMRNKIKAIPTKYKGIKFRSKMESLFAKWCDKNKQKWLYEPEGFVLKGECYLPDFYLPDSKMIIEIKPLFFIKETHKFDMIFNSEEFSNFGLVVIEMTPNLSVIKYSEPALDESKEDSSMGRHWDSREECHSIGFCYDCGAFNICGHGVWDCKACGYYDGDCTVTAEF